MQSTRRAWWQRAALATCGLAGALVLWSALAAAVGPAGTKVSRAQAQGDVVAQRQAQMKAMARALDPLLDMARGRVPYDGAAAAAAAAQLAELAAGDAMALYPAGSDRENMGRSLALPAIWQDEAGFRAAHRALAEAAAQLQQRAGSGPGELQGAVGGVGSACSGCHKRFRAPR